MEKLGLVLCGGGARGAFQVGVWEELDKLGITKQITGFSGTSIGAVNTALFLSRTSNKEKEKIWESFKQSDMISPNVGISMTLAVLKKMIPKINVGIVIPDLLFNGICTQNKLKSLLEELTLKPRIIRKSDVFSSVTDLSVGCFKTAYINWNLLSHDRIKDYVRYSAKIPIFNGAHVSLNRVTHFIVDGGVKDLVCQNLSNTPIAPLYAKGYRKFIVVYLKSEDEIKEQREKEDKWFKGAEICRLYYYKPTNFLSVVTIDKDRTKKCIEEGKKAVKIMLNKSQDNSLIFEKTKVGQNEETIAKTNKCIQNGEKVVNGKVESYLE